MKPTLKIDTSNFNRAIKDIARYSGASLGDVIEHEAGKVLEAAVRYTPAAKIAAIKDKFSKSELWMGDAGNGKKLYDLRHRYPDRIWQTIEAKRKASLQKKLRARGLSKQSWYLLAAELGLVIKVPGFVPKALARSGKTHPENFTARRLRTRAGAGIYFANRQPTVQTPAVRGRSALQRAINGRAAFFRRNLAAGVFRDVKKIAAKYPGCRVR